jgi:K+-sensing histidine kinase KdpD
MVITVNYDINNPLSIISTNAQTLRLLDKNLSEKSTDKLRKIEEQVKRIAAVTERLREMDEVVTDEYIRGGEQMIDVWKEQEGGAVQQEEE